MIILPVVITLLGLFLSVRLGPFFITHPIKTLRCAASALDNKKSRESFFLALAGTLGVGNIFGVSLGITVGGVGSIFWLFVSSFFSMIIKYSEVVLGFSVKSPLSGMPSVIREICPNYGAFVSRLYALFGFLLSLFMGALLQTRSISDTAQGIGIDARIAVIWALVFTLYFVIFGSEKIKRATYYIIPLTTIIYIFLSFSVIFKNISSFIPTILEILKSAFTVEGAVGGGVAYLSKCGFHEGFVRGVMSNEAGAGTSLVGHSQGDGRAPSAAGVCGILEVAFDTLLLCPLTGLVIVCSGVPIVPSPMHLVLSAFSATLGTWVQPLLLFSVFSFAYSTIMSLYYYGLVYSDELKIPRIIFSLAFLSLMLASPLVGNGFVGVIDALLLLMTLPTAYCIIKSVGMIKHHTDTLLK